MPPSDSNKWAIELGFNLTQREVLALLCSCARSYRINEEDKQDFIHHCWIQTQHALLSYRGGSSQGFIREIVRRQALVYFRDCSSGRRLTDRIHDASQVKEQINGASIELVLSLREAVANLESQEREILNLHDIMGIPLNDAAASLDVSPSRAYALRQRALRKLRRLLDNASRDELKQDSRPRPRGLYLLVPCMFAAACTMLAVGIPRYLDQGLEIIQDALGCFVREAPFEDTDVRRGGAPCLRRESGLARAALHYNQYPKLSSEVLALLSDYLAKEQSHAALRFGDLLDASEEGASSRHRDAVKLRDSIARAHTLFSRSPLVEDVQIFMPGTTNISADGFIPENRRTVYTLDRLAVDFCDDDVGWEFGCDEEELVVVWVTLGEGYFACGMSPVLAHMSMEAPFEGRLAMLGDLEFGRQPPAVHLFTSVVDIDPGGGSRHDMLRALEIAVMAVFSLREGHLSRISRFDADSIRDMFTMVLRLASEENDVRDFKYASNAVEGHVDLVLEKEPVGAYLVRLGIEGP